MKIRAINLFIYQIDKPVQHLDDGKLVEQEKTL